MPHRFAAPRSASIVARGRGRPPADRSVRLDGHPIHLVRLSNPSGGVAEPARPRAEGTTVSYEIVTYTRMPLDILNTAGEEHDSWLPGDP